MSADDGHHARRLRRLLLLRRGLRVLASPVLFEVKLVTRHVHVLNRAAGDVAHALLPLRVPGDRLGGGARDGLTEGAGGVRAVAVLHSGDEVLLEDLAKEVVLLGGGRVEGEPLLAVGELLVAHHLVGVVLEAVDPVVADAVGELLLLAPEHLVGEVRLVGGVESLAEEVLLEKRVPVLVRLVHADHLLLRVGVHGVVAHLLGQERGANLDAPRHGGLVRAKDVPLVQAGGLPGALLVELRGGGSLVEVEVAAEELVRALAGEHHLEPVALDGARQQVHRHGRADLLERLEVPDDIRERVERLLGGEVDLVVDGAEGVGHLPGGDEIGRALDADGEGMHGLVRAEGVLGLLLVPHRDGGDEGGVEAAGEEHRVRNVRHQAILHRVDDGLPELGVVRLAIGDVLHVGHPLRVVPADHLALGLTLLADVVVARWENLVLGDSRVVDQGLHLAGEPHAAVLTVGDVAGNLAHVVAARHDGARLAILDDEREHPVELADEFGSVLLVEVTDDLAVALVLGHDVVLLAEVLVVVDLAVGDEGGVVRRVGVERLLTRRAGRDDGEALVDHVRLLTVLLDGNVHLVRVRAAVANALGQSVHSLPVVQRVAREAEDGEDAAHFSRSTQLARAAVSLLRCLKTRTEAPASTETMGNRRNGGQYRRYAERRASHCAIGGTESPAA